MSPDAKTDFVKEQKELYRPSAKTVVAVKVPKMRFLMMDGEGDPNDSVAFQEACEVLYGLSYTLKFGSKLSGGQDWKVAPLEGLWWADDMSAFTEAEKDDWKWTLMIRQPDVVTAGKLKEAAEQLHKKKNPAGLDRVRFESFAEGLCAQILHIGPYDAEAPNIEKMHAFIAEQGRERHGKHHEIYMSDPRRTAPEKLKTVLRQGMR